MGGSSPRSPRGSHVPWWQQDAWQPRGCSLPARSGGQNQFAKHTQSLKSHWEQGGTHVTVVQVALGEGPQPCPHPWDPPVGVEEDVNEHGGDGRQRVRGHGQDAEAGLGALHGVQRGACSWRGESHSSGVGTAWGQYRSATPWPPQPQPGIPQGTEVPPVGAGASRRGTGWSWGTWDLASLTRLGLQEAVAHVIAGDRDTLATLLLVDVKLPRQRVDHHRQVPLPHLARGAG